MSIFSYGKYKEKLKVEFDKNKTTKYKGDMRVFCQTFTVVRPKHCLRRQSMFHKYKDVNPKGRRLSPELFFQRFNKEKVRYVNILR